MRTNLTPLSSLGLTLACLVTASQAAEQKPNLIVIMCDDLGYADVGFNGSREIPTPNIDRIAKEGVRFDSGYVTYSVSSPSRAGLITGRYPQRFGYERNPIYRPDELNIGLPLTEMTIAESLKKAGYTSGIIGKWHLGAHRKNHPCNRGFDEFYGHLGGGHHYFPHQLIHPNSYEIHNESKSYATHIMRNHGHVKTSEYLTDEFSREAQEFVERHKDKPFFLYLAYNAPHTPMQATPKYLSRFPDLKGRRKTYAAMVSAVDDGVGGLLNKLDELKIADNTIVFFLSDNGGPEPHNSSDNGVLREGKSSSYEGGFRVPFAMRWGSKIKAGMDYKYPITSLDIFATISALSKSPTAKPLDGVNLIPYLTGEKSGPPHEYIYLRKLDEGRYAVRHHDYKLLVFGKKKQYQELYNLAEDIGENNNLIKEEVEIAAKIDKERLKWDKELIDPVFDGLGSERKKKQDEKDRLEQQKKKQQQKKN